MSSYLDETASQTAGPYVHIGLIPAQAGFDIFQNNFSNQLAGAETKGERIRIEGYVIDGTGAPIRDALLEIWQANAAGRYNHPEDKASPDAPLDPNFRGWGRGGTDFRTALYHFDTIKPGALPMLDGRMQAPHVNFWITARGINIGLQTRMYFADESAANAADPLLRLIEQDSRRQTLIAPREARDGTIVYRFDIRLQGDGETVFLDV
ncbi:protocatechuate 3,4-dioxygenase subunit alpha [Ferrovibrio sp.]|uniref:protocatechuate 3,4-dioxygenase subunit alpha n=1 Tax=Ferrovibrio sp. TaxID=1917215 RepID=UPI0025BC5E8F|nr:protocatechuate 3,4-dioxygenase subunit alpha [Ferrovibrio sp.]MBX3453862.1 protocatechuate 3,4-dioxygenase subunit alpha [Ferrovibrio sp.]